MGINVVLLNDSCNWLARRLIFSSFAKSELKKNELNAEFGSFMKFKTADINDLEALNSISVRSKAYWGYPESWMEKWLDELTLDADKFSNQHIMVVEYESKIIGFSSVVENKDNYEILHLWILPKFIGKGFGKMLLEKTIQKFVTTDKAIIVESDPNAEKFYESQGFITFDRVESIPKGRFLPLMKKLLPTKIFNQK